jgi:hypothetical protein
MSGSSKDSSPSSGHTNSLVVRVERLREQAEAFQKTVEAERQALDRELKARHIHRRRRPTGSG